MHQELEIEFKNLLSKQEYQLFTQLFKSHSDNRWIQKNYYFDTPDYRLAQQHSALRIRLFSESAEITLKTPHEGHLLESNESLPLAEAMDMVADKSIKLSEQLLSILTEMGIDATELELKTDLITERFEVDYKEGLLVFDKSRYGDYVDYEIEYEVVDAESGRVNFKEFLSKHNIPYRKAENKIARAVKKLNI